jgi:hypothetical protein
MISTTTRNTVEEPFPSTGGVPRTISTTQAAQEEKTRVDQLDPDGEPRDKVHPLDRDPHAREDHGPTSPGTAAPTWGSICPRGRETTLCFTRQKGEVFAVVL